MDIRRVSAVKSSLGRYIKNLQDTNQIRENPIAQRVIGDYEALMMQGGPDAPDPFDTTQGQFTKAIANEFGCEPIVSDNEDLEIERELLCQISKLKKGRELEIVFDDLPELLDQLPSKEAGEILRLLIDDYIYRRMAANAVKNRQLEKLGKYSENWSRTGQELRDLAIKLNPETLMLIDKPSDEQSPAKTKLKKRI